MARILLADDDGASRDLVRRALESEGHSVDATQDGAEALERVAAGRYDLLVSDIEMPGLDGIALAAEALKRNPGLGVVLMSGYPEKLARAAVATTRRASVAKPFALEEIKAAVRGLLA